MSKYSNNNMTPVTLVDRLNAFKERVDGLGNTVKSFELDVDYKKVGGLHHWRIGRLGGSVYLKKSKVAKLKPKASDVVITAQPVETSTVRDWQERMLIGTGKSTVGWTAIED